MTSWKCSSGSTLTSTAEAGPGTVTSVRRSEYPCDRTDRWYLPGGTLSNVKVPSAPDIVSRRSSSRSTVAPGIGSPDSELTNRPESGAAACAAAFTACVDTTASSAHAAKSGRTCISVSSKKRLSRLTEQQLERAAVRGEEAALPDRRPARQRRERGCGRCPRGTAQGGRQYSTAAGTTASGDRGCSAATTAGHRSTGGSMNDRRDRARRRSSNSRRHGSPPRGSTARALRRRPAAEAPDR